tara:strand:+ start:594 stop:1064 length:471 start_codon:yes stop_codon:yes gene_type:complete
VVQLSSVVKNCQRLTHKQKGEKMTKRVPLHTRLKQLREARGYSFRKLSSILLEKYDVKIAHSALQKWEQPSKKARVAKPEFIGALCKLYNVRPSFLLDQIFDVPSKADRLSQLADVDLLSDEDFTALVSIKNSLIGKSQDKKLDEKIVGKSSTNSE